MISTVSSVSALNATLASAHAGDTIQLASGAYNGVVLSGLHFASDVTITAAPNANAVLTGLTVSGSSGLTFSNLEFFVDPHGVQNPFVVKAGSADIHFDHLNVHGSLNGSAADDLSAFVLRDSTDVSVTNSQFQQLWIAIGHQNVDGLTVTGNAIHDIRMDGVRGGGSSNVTVSNNTFTNFFPATGEHPDAIQFWTTGTTTVTKNITVADNLMTRGVGATIQGVFLGDEANTGYQHVHISGNGVIGEAYNGIAVYGGSDVTIDHNIVQGFSGQKSWIRLERVTGGSVDHDQTNVIVAPATTTGVVYAANTILPQATDGGAAALQAWQAAHPATTASTGAPETPATGPSSGGSSTGGGDTLTGGDGAQLSGGPGDDVYILTGKATVIEAANAGVDTVRTGASYSLPANVENLQFSGTTYANGYGNALDNVMTGNAYGNHLLGDAGADTLIGGGGGDVLTGGAGADRFVFARGDGRDTVTDFGAGGEHDVIDLSDFYAHGLSATLTDSAAGVTLTFSTGETILLQGVHPASLHATATGFVF